MEVDTQSFSGVPLQAYSDMQIQRQAKLPTALTFFFKLVTYPKAGSTLKYLYFLKEQNFIYSPVSIKGALRLDV